ncbi:MAG: hypothetical protein AAGA28_16275 [Pseudomonadota bacterium]
MSHFESELQRIHAEILNMDADQQYQLQPRLDNVIARSRRAGAPVPADIEKLNAKLIDEAIEAQFDNLPV